MSTAEGFPRHRKTRAANSRTIIKEEPAEDDIKDFAETTMNELLGWYGYDKVDSRDTQGLNLQHFTGATSPSTTPDGSGSEDGTSSRTPGDGPPCNGLSSGSGSPQNEDIAGLPPGCIICAWCQKVGMKLFTLKSAHGSKAFCSELCFTQCRRASFKKNKICDWCKHVRHTVNYVDFQDGEQQLQFCSDKCLNQYKMNIFCRETQAHLQMHPHLQEAGSKAPTGGGALITPDLWMRDCKNNGHDASDEREGTPENLSVLASPPINNPSPRTRTPEKEQLPVCLTKHSSRHRIRRMGRYFGRKNSSDAAARPPSTHSRHTVRSPNSNCSTPQSTSSNNSHHNPVINGPSSGPRLGTSPHSQPPHPHPLSSHHPFHLGGPFGPGDNIRPPFPPPGLLPGPLNLLAQQHMESFMRLHHGIRPPLLPPGLFPPFPNFPPSGSVPNSMGPQQPPPPFHPPSHPAQPGAPLVPPVTMLVPYPILLPLPVPIPIVLPIPLNLFNKKDDGDAKTQDKRCKQPAGASSKRCSMPSVNNLSQRSRRDHLVGNDPSRSYPDDDDTGDDSSTNLMEGLTSDDDSMSDTPADDDLSDSPVPSARSFESFSLKIKTEPVMSESPHRPLTATVHRSVKRTTETGLDFSQGKRKILGNQTDS